MNVSGSVHMQQAHVYNMMCVLIYTSCFKS